MITMLKVRFSIIIPHKNIPDLLLRCLGSVPQRDDVEVIIVDDDSDPDIVDFEHFPGLGISGVEVFFTKVGKGAGYARNIGIEHAKGEWLLFADADDCFFIENLNKLFDIALPDDCEVVSWRYKRKDSIGTIKRFSMLDGLEEEYAFVKRYDVMKQLMYCQPWTKMVKAEMIKRNNIRFEEVPVSNDIMFSARIFVAIEHYYFFNTDCYYYINRSNSLTKTISIENIKTRQEVAVRVDEFIRRSGKYFKYDGLYGNWLAQLHYPIFFRLFCKDVINNGFHNAYNRYLISCLNNDTPISRIPYYTFLKRKIKRIFNVNATSFRNCT